MSSINEIVVTRIENELNHLPSTPSDREDKAMSSMNMIVTDVENVLNHQTLTPSNQIFLVPNQLRRVNKEAYKPNIISIGPYHQGKDHLAAMEEHKFRYLKLFLQRRDNSSIATYVEALSKLNERAKNSYEKRFREETCPGDFLKTMLVDGCFIVELIRRSVVEDVGTDDPIFGHDMILCSLKRDLLLLENQLPFFILQELFHMTSLRNEESNLEAMIYGFFEILPRWGYPRRKEHNLPNVPVRHLLALMHDNCLPTPQAVTTYLNWTEQEKQRTNEKAHIRCAAEVHETGIKLLINCGLICGKEASKADHAEAHIRCATELHEAGIKFKRAEAEGCSIFDIKFANGVLEIPKIRIVDRTECLLRNLIAYELFSKDDICQFIDYACFMDCLINSNKDVELLCRSGIIDNWLGDDEVIASIFNRLLDNVVVSKRSFYSEIYVKVNKYRGRKWNLWKAKLRHDYFNGPWALISFLAAVFLLLFTALQAVYSVLAYHHS